MRSFLFAFITLLVGALISTTPFDIAERRSHAESPQPEIASDGWEMETPEVESEPAYTRLKPKDMEAFKDKGDWCSEHKVPESMCVLCNPDLIEGFKAKKDWCTPHGVPESICALCNSALRKAGMGLSPEGGASEWTGGFTVESIADFKAKGDWCMEHSVPESQCTKCNLALIPEFKAKMDWCQEHNLPESHCYFCNPALAELGIGKDWCELHQLPKSQCVICQMNEGLKVSEDAESLQKEMALKAIQKLPLNLSSDDPSQRLGINPNCPLHAVQILFASPEVADKVGIEVEIADPTVITQHLNCYGEIEYDQSRYTWLSARAPGIVESVKVDLGATVEKGQIVAVVDSVEIGEAKANLLRANATYDRTQWIHQSYETTNGSGAVSRKELVEAKADLDQAAIELEIAKQTLLNLGLDSSSVKTVLEKKDTTTSLPIAAPYAGTVVELKATPGEVVDRGGPIFAMADTSAMWAMLEVFVKDLPKIQTGMTASFVPEGLEGEVFVGSVDWISTQLDAKTRTAKVRAILDNGDGRIRAGLFGKGSIELTPRSEQLTVPRASVQWDGCCNLVFVRKSKQLYQPRKVRIGYADGGSYVIQAGLLPGEEVVTTGSYLLKTEILKGSIGAGCTCGG